MHRKPLCHNERELEPLVKRNNELTHRYFCPSEALSNHAHIQDYKKIIHEALYLAAVTGNYDEFLKLFEKNVIDKDEYYIEGSKKKTFLHILIKNDINLSNHPESIGRKNIARYLLSKGADINKCSYGVKGRLIASPLEMFTQYNDRSRDIFSILKSRPQYGVNIFSVFKEYFEELNRYLIVYS